MILSNHHIQFYGGRTVNANLLCYIIETIAQTNLSMYNKTFSKANHTN